MGPAKSVSFPASTTWHMAWRAVCGWIHACASSASCSLISWKATGSAVLCPRAMARRSRAWAPTSQLRVSSGSSTSSSDLAQSGSSSTSAIIPTHTCIEAIGKPTWLPPATTVTLRARVGLASARVTIHSTESCRRDSGTLPEARATMSEQKSLMAGRKKRGEYSTSSTRISSISLVWGSASLETAWGSLTDPRIEGRSTWNTLICPSARLPRKAQRALRAARRTGTVSARRASSTWTITAGSSCGITLSAIRAKTSRAISRCEGPGWLTSAMSACRRPGQPCCGSSSSNSDASSASASHTLLRIVSSCSSCTD
mmetsp:Transcript_60129/g.135957  ORF Transcript_60129/g.135957 Transcript_60129/m.135957 type:complete len:314 (-) Transcript_60129:48-989(-)